MSEEQNTTPAENTSQESTQETTQETTQRSAFSQEDVNKLTGTARKEAREAAQREIDRKYAEELGVSLDEAKAILQQAREAEEARQSDLEKANKQRAKLENDHAKLKEELDGAYAHIADMKQEAALRTALSEAEINPAFTRAALKLADYDLLDIDDEGNVTGMDAVIEGIREESPVWFNGARPRTSPDATRKDRPVTGVWEMPKEQFEEYQRRVQNGERVTFPRT